MVELLSSTKALCFSFWKLSLRNAVVSYAVLQVFLLYSFNFWEGGRAIFFHHLSGLWTSGVTHLQLQVISAQTWLSPFKGECLEPNGLRSKNATLHVHSFDSVGLAHAPRRESKACREEGICAAVKGSICCVIVAHGLLPSLIKQSRAVHPKSAALLTLHQSPAVCRLDAVLAPEVIHCLLWKRKVQRDKAAPCSPLLQLWGAAPCAPQMAGGVSHRGTG